MTSAACIGTRSKEGEAGGGGIQHFGDRPTKINNEIKEEEVCCL